MPQILDFFRLLFRPLGTLTTGDIFDKWAKGSQEWRRWDTFYHAECWSLNQEHHAFIQAKWCQQTKADCVGMSSSLSPEDYFKHPAPWQKPNKDGSLRMCCRTATKGHTVNNFFADIIFRGLRPKNVFENFIFAVDDEFTLTHELLCRVPAAFSCQYGRSWPRIPRKLVSQRKFGVSQ